MCAILQGALFLNLSTQLSFLTSITLLHFQCTNNTLRDPYVPECESKVSSTRSDSRAKCRSSSLLLFLPFLYRPSNWNWVVTSPVGGFSRQIPENPHRDRWPPPSRASREFRSGKRKSGELQWWKRRKKSERTRNVPQREREDGGVFHIDTLLYLSYPLAISFGIYHHHVWSNC